ncbi:hypothetical protein GCM10007392_24710 [Saccharospirillum salsuginis]|uniref:Uncharacterized protein n=1 Tax=Saccharospirillum salsuginis TaxID=418750 RepID=A0A918NBK2_9GAMM|nr:hypothetical protein GCM10007392_24710 [Saccharospirillum salsuginis]
MGARQLRRRPIDDRGFHVRPDRDGDGIAGVRLAGRVDNHGFHDPGQRLSQLFFGLVNKSVGGVFIGTDQDVIHIEFDPVHAQVVLRIGPHFDRQAGHQRRPFNWGGQ